MGWIIGKYLVMIQQVWNIKEKLMFFDLLLFLAEKCMFVCKYGLFALNLQSKSKEMNNIIVIGLIVSTVVISSLANGER